MRCVGSQDWGDLGADQACCVGDAGGNRTRPVGGDWAARQLSRIEIEGATADFRPSREWPLAVSTCRADAVRVDFWTIEVADGPASTAARWRDSHGNALIESAITHGAREWGWVLRDWGAVFEVAFTDEADWLRFPATPRRWGRSGRGARSRRRAARVPGPRR